MKKAAFLLMLTTIILVVCNCETPEVIDDNEDQQEEVDQTDKGKANDGDDSGDNENDSTSTDNDDDGYTDTDDGTDPNYDGGSNYEEHDIVDGNDDSGNQVKTGDTLNCAKFIDADFDCGVYVVGYIVGACTKNISNADFEAPFSAPQAILIADKKGERDTDKILSIELKSGGKYRSTFNLKDNPGNLGRRIIVFGYKTTYLRIVGIKSPGSIEFFD